MWIPTISSRSDEQTVQLEHARILDHFVPFVSLYVHLRLTDAAFQVLLQEHTLTLVMHDHRGVDLALCEAQLERLTSVPSAVVGS